MISQQLCVLVFDPSGSSRTPIHDALTAFAVRNDTEVTIHWVSPEAGSESVERVFDEADLALFAADTEGNSARLGAQLRERNRACELVYFGNAAQQPDVVSYFTRLFPSCPIGYLERPDQNAFLKAVEDCALRRALTQCFFWQGKQAQLHIPLSQILCFRSERNYVCIQLRGGTEYRLLTKLDTVERQLPKSSFLRIHQSYLVNRAEIRQIDKAKHSVLLSNGQELFISKAHYLQTINEAKDGV